MPPSELVTVLAGLLGFLAVASIIGYALKRRFSADGSNSAVENLNDRVRSWWIMIILMGIALATGRPGVIVFFALCSFAALREFITLTDTRRADHAALAIAFFIILPAQYYLVWIDWYGLYAIFIPVYAFLLMPIVAAWRGDTDHFLARIAETQWALMICVFCTSHVPALLSLDIAGFSGRNVMLIAFLVIVVQSSDVLQYVWGKLIGRTKIAPKLSPSKTVEGFVGGAERDRRRRSAILDNAVLPDPGRGNLPRDCRDGLLRRPRHVGDQARPRCQGLGASHRGSWRFSGSPRFRAFFRTHLLSHHALLVVRLRNLHATLSA